MRAVCAAARRPSIGQTLVALSARCATVAQGRGTGVTATAAPGARTMAVPPAARRRRLKGASMPTLRTDDGVNLHYEEAGSGTPIVFVHEFAGDHRSWEPQMRHFARTHRCIAYNARGYPPSGVPDGAERYEQARQRDDIRRGARCAGDWPGPHRRLLDGRVRHAALRLAARHLGRPLTRAVAHAGRHGLGRAPGHVPALPTRQRRAGAGHPARRHGALRGHLRPWRVAPAIAAQGSARLRRVRAPAGRALGRGFGEHDGRLPGTSAVPVRADRPDGVDQRAAAGSERRRGRAVPGAVAADQARGADARAWRSCPAPDTR